MYLHTYNIFVCIHTYNLLSTFTKRYYFNFLIFLDMVVIINIHLEVHVPVAESVNLYHGAPDLLLREVQVLLDLAGHHVPPDLVLILHRQGNFYLNYS